MKTLLCGLWAAFLLFVMAGCGGGGGSVGGGGGGGGGSFLIAADFRGVQGLLVAAVNKSQTPQSVQLDVNGTTQTINNVLVAIDMSVGREVVLIREGTKLLNMTITNPSAGVSIGATGLKVPVAADSTLQASILSPFGVALLTPPGTWQGFSMPNGFQVTLLSDADRAGETRAVMNATVTPPTGNQTMTDGTTTVTYTSPNPFFRMAASFVSAQMIIGVTGPNGLTAENGTITSDWLCQRKSSGTPIFTDPTMEIYFSNLP